MWGVIVDLETGGLNAQAHPITQIGAVAVTASFDILKEFEVKIKFSPDFCDPKALKINGFNPDVWQREALPEQEALFRFAEFLEDHVTYFAAGGKGRGQAILMGHNGTSFDWVFLDRLSKKHDIKLPAWRMLDSIQYLYWYFEHRRGKIEPPEGWGLEKLARYFGVSYNSAHDALADCKILTQILKKVRVGK